jgi:hypothetical protein
MRVSIVLFAASVVFTAISNSAHAAQAVHVAHEFLTELQRETRNGQIANNIAKERILEQKRREFAEQVLPLLAKAAQIGEYSASAWKMPWGFDGHVLAAKLREIDYKNFPKWWNSNYDVPCHLDDDNIIIWSWDEKQ